MVIRITKKPQLIVVFSIFVKMSQSSFPSSKFKRRSGRNVKRKKYMDDVDLNLSDDDDTMDMPARDTEGPVVKPVLFVVCMVVSY